MKVIRIFRFVIALGLIESCLTVDPLTIVVDLADLNLINYKGEKNTLPFEQRQEKANYYKMKGLEKMNSTDTNDLKLARKYFLASLTYVDTKGEIWSYLGDVYYKEFEINKTSDSCNRLTNAVYYFTHAIYWDDLNAPYYYKRGMAYYALNDTSCFSDFSKSCSLGNNIACNKLKTLEEK